MTKHYVPQPQEKNDPQNRAATAAGNNSSIQTAAPLGPAAAVDFSTTITPKVGGKLLLSGFISGVVSAATLVAISLRVNGADIQIITTQTAGGVNQFSGSLTAIEALGGGGFPVGTPVTVSIHALAVAGNITVTPPANNAGITVEEIPLS